MQEYIQTCKFHVKIKFELSEEASSCNKEIIWWTKVDYSIKWRSLPHSNSVINYLNENVPDYIRKENLPSNFCNLNPIDYAIWDMMENMIFQNVKRYEDIKGFQQ